MEVFEEFLRSIDNPEHRARTEEVLDWVSEKFPDLIPVFKWNQPMFTDHGTYIIGFSVAKYHMGVAPEVAGINHFFDKIVAAGYKHTKGLVQFPWENAFDFTLLKKMIEYNILDKADCSTFWR